MDSRGAEVMTGVFVTFAICAAAFIGFAIVLVIRGGRRPADAYLIAASTLTGLWASSMAVLWLSPEIDHHAYMIAARPLEVIASVAWILFLAELAVPKQVKMGRLSRRAILLTIAGLVGAVCACLELSLFFAQPANLSIVSVLMFTARVCLSLLGLTVIDNLVRNASEDGFWSIKYLGIGLGGWFAYDFFVYADALLFRNINSDFLELRGAIALLALPLIVIGAKRSLLPDRPIALSHRMAFHSVVILGGGIYLVLMGAAGYYIREFGGSHSKMFSGLFLFGALVLLAVVFASHSTRSWLKVWLYKNLFLYKYDYRQEWLQFIQTITADQSGTNLRLRVIKSIANIVDSTGGVLWEWQDRSQSYEVTEKWNYRSFSVDHSPDSQFAAFLANTGWIINLNDWRAEPQAYDGIDMPVWLRDAKEAWVLIPLMHRSHVLGIVMMKQPRVSRMLNWEDFDLLKTCAQQAASYLSESAAVRALSEARELEIFNRRFAFVVHDIKTTINQLSLVLKNAEKHGENPAFQKDVLVSVGDSVAAMSGILEQINTERQRSPSVSSIDIAALIEGVVAQRRKGGGAAIHMGFDSQPIKVMADEHRLTAIVSHLVQNAMDAAGDKGQVTISLHPVDNVVICEVEDNGHGMAPEFIRDQLFQPFKSTKGSGYGIGAYQCRELIRELGGRLTVHSVPGEGTLMAVSLPKAPLASIMPLVEKAS